jgi:hypothetical protein
LWKDQKPSAAEPATTAKAENIQPGVISMRISRDLRGKAARNGRRIRQMIASAAVCSQLKPLSSASTAATASTTTLASQAPPSRRRSPKASKTRTRPRMLETKWLSSTNHSGMTRTSQVKRSGSEGVAPETSSMIPAPTAKAAATSGPTSRAAGFKSPRTRMQDPDSPRTLPS